MKKGITPLVSAYEARTLILDKKADVSSTLKDSWGNVHLYFIRRDDGKLYRTLLNVVWQKAFENVGILPFVPEDQKKRTIDDRDSLSRGLHPDNGPSQDELDVSEAEKDHSDDICPCGDPDCSRPFGHPEEREK